MSTFERMTELQIHYILNLMRGTLKITTLLSNNIIQQKGVELL
jgi:hypothetical protein